MKKLLILFLLVSCTSKKIEVKKDDVVVAEYVIDGFNLVTEIKIDGCHYLFHYKTSIIHKANCPNHQKHD